MEPGSARKHDESLRDFLGLRPCRDVMRQPAFYLALAAGPAFVLALQSLAPGALPTATPTLPMLLSLLLWQPLVEELLFRGLLQGWLASRLPGALNYSPISHANLLTSALFAAAHLLQHPPLWAAASFAPSLVFGYFRDRAGSVLPALALHITYNASYFLLH